ncbi:hypothetical protein AJ80_05602 [Polytolypa hystricis UAMH7299]|uniref:Glycosyl transferase family 17 protein n=1 Tax=Polytolypa hystricis (strain UAMH7299) TaxID=1447883 RepID=A0A2B7Y289_POLH7|nr:hypothetical protein AJ80_05602 [Polytolypa hystricis UAMH7299]
MRFGRRMRLRALVVLLLTTVLLYCWINLVPKPQRLDNRTYEILSKHANTNNGNSKALPDQAARELCDIYGWNVYRRPDNSPRKVYDLFLINTELDWFEIRINELDQHVDYFVVAEAKTTFTGRPKPLALNATWDRFEKFHHKIIYHQVEGRGENEKTPWDHERFQRSSLLNQVFPKLEGKQKPQLGDVILVSDIDEITRPETMALLRTCDYPRRVNLRSRFYYYSFQWLHRGPDWNHPQATYYEGKHTIEPEDLRMGVGGQLLHNWFGAKADIWNAAWHCSSCFSTIQEMQFKIQAFSHTIWDRPEFKDPPQVVRRVRNGLDLFDRPREKYDRVENNQDVPSFLKKNYEKFSYMLNRDPENANFRDYVPPQ